MYQSKNKTNFQRKNLTSLIVQHKTKLNGNESFANNRTESKTDQSLQRVMKQSLKSSSSVQLKSNLKGRKEDASLRGKWQPTIDFLTLNNYVDKAVFDWIDCAIKLGLPKIDRREFGHGSKKSKGGSGKANNAYRTLRSNCRSAARVADNYKLKQL